MAGRVSAERDLNGAESFVLLRRGSESASARRPLFVEAALGRVGEGHGHLVHAVNTTLRVAAVFGAALLACALHAVNPVLVKLPDFR